MGTIQTKAVAATGSGTTRAELAVSVGIVGLVLAALVWCYSDVIGQLVKDWQSSKNYSVGVLVPFVALYLLWLDRGRLSGCPIKPCWWGLGLVLLAQLAHLYALPFLQEALDRYSLILSAVGAVLLIAGRRVVWRLKWLFLFLFLMFPLPGRVHNLIMMPLQEIAISGAVFLLQVFLFGLTVTRSNTMVAIGGVSADVSEGCIGMRMLTAFIVVAATLAFLVARPRWQKTVLVLSSIPVGIACNIGRLCATAIAFYVLGEKAGKAWFDLYHDWLGYAMMPLAVLFLMWELWIMKKLVVPEPQPARHGKAASPGKHASRPGRNGKNGHRRRRQLAASRSGA